MTAIPTKNRVKEEKEMRQVYCETLMELADENQNIVVDRKSVV